MNTVTEPLQGLYSQHFIFRNLQMGAISHNVCQWQAFPTKSHV
jgi:hypothetical protein